MQCRDGCAKDGGIASLAVVSANFQAEDIWLTYLLQCCPIRTQLCGISLLLPWPAHTPPPTAREMPTPRPTAAATTRRAMTILAHSLCLLVKFLNRLQPRVRLYVFRWSMTACLDGHMVHSLTLPSTDDLGCCVVAAERGAPASRSRSTTSRCVLLWGALLASMERRASGCL